MSKDILEEFARLESRQNFVVAVEEVLSSTKTKRSVDFDTLVSLEKKHPRMVSTVVSDFRNGGLAFEELSAVKKGLIGAGLFAIIAMILRFLGIGEGGGSGGGGGGGGGGSSRAVALDRSIDDVNKAIKQSEETAKILEDNEEKISEVIDEIIESLSDEATIANGESSEEVKVIEELFDVGGSSGTALAEDVAQHTPLKQKIEAVKRNKVTNQQLYESMAIRVYRTVNVSSLWLNGDLDYLTGMVVGNIRSRAEIGNLPCFEFVQNIIDYMDHCHHCFMTVHEKIQDGNMELFNTDYPTHDYPNFKLSPYLYAFVTDSEDTGGNKPSPSSLNHMSRTKVDKYTELLKTPMTEADIKSLIDRRGQGSFFTEIDTRSNQASGVLHVITEIITKLSNAGLETVDNEINTIHSRYSVDKNYPLAMHKLYKEYKQIELFCKNIMSLIMLVENIFSRVKTANNKLSNTLNKQDALIKRINKYRVA